MAKVEDVSVPPVLQGIPDEASEFFRSKGARSLIVCGAPGSGKTTFAIQLLQDLDVLTSAHYESTRVSDRALLDRVAWLGDGPLPHGLEHASSTVGEEKLPEETAMGTLLKLMEGGKRLDTEDDASPISVQLVDGEVVVERSATPEILAAYGFVRDTWPKRAFVVIDSIDALSERYGIAAGRLITAMQKDLVERNAANLVYVLEREDSQRLAYLGDGVVRLSTVDFAKRRARMIELEKLRGVEIKQPRYLFTLHRNRFRVFGSWRDFQLRPINLWRSVPDGSAEVVSTGHPDLDRIIGGFRRGTIVAIECAPAVPPTFIDAVIHGLIANFATQSRGVIHAPARRGTSEALERALEAYADKRDLRTHLRVVCEPPKEGEFAPGKDPDSDLRWANLEYKLPSSSRPFLSLLSFDTLESVYGPQVLDGISRHMGSVRRSQDLFVGLTSPLLASNERLTAMAHVHLKFDSLNGSMVFYGEKPHTELFSVDFALEAGTLRARLTPIV